MLNGYPRITPIGRDALDRALALRDLTDEADHYDRLHYPRDGRSAPPHRHATRA